MVARLNQKCFTCIYLTNNIFNFSEALKIITPVNNKGEEHTLDGSMKSEQATAPTNHSAVMDSRKEVSEKISNEQDTSKRKDECTNTVPFYKLFSFADSLDYLLIFAGTIAAVGNGSSLPLMTLIFGNLVNSFGEFGNTKEVAHEVSKVF